MRKDSTRFQELELIAKRSTAVSRFKGILVERDACLIELTRYVVLNPVRAGMREAPEQWPWSSYGAAIGASLAPSWLAVDALLSQFAASRKEARRRYRAFVFEGIG
ncbi:hypothetical protein [Thioflavicoccus mobilis]|uniref:hypothetical protein n=1 Tax=Thioflavicoccus mobilis TaxID=80679 RepID=UPI000688C488|nr:hypothetical protein [Thioflavicoccus mobilis]